MGAATLATVTPSHRVIDFVVSRDVAGACEATTQIFEQIAFHHASLLAEQASDEQTQVEASPECEVYCDVARRDIKEASGTHACWSTLMTRWSWIVGIFLVSAW